MFPNKLSIFAAFALVVLLPLGVGAAIDSTSFQIDPAENTISVHHNVTSTSYALDGSIDPLSGKESSASFTVESGDAFRYYCGDGFVDPGEDCDTGSYGTNLNSKTCVSEGFASGSISCSSTCTLVTSACVAVSSGGGGGGGGGGSSTSTTSAAPASPTVDSSFTTSGFFTYGDKLFIYGTVDSKTTSVSVNGSSTGVTIVGSSWQTTVNLKTGDNVFSIVSKDASGKVSNTTTLTIHRRLMADTNDDKTVNDYDLSLLVKMWKSKNVAGDFNADAIVDDYDFSILVSHWNS